MGINLLLTNWTELCRSVFCRWRDRERVLYGPAFGYATRDSLVSESGTPRPIGDTECFPHVSKEMIHARVVHLFKMCDPQTVVRLVAKRIISTFQFVLWGWPWPHVYVEINKIIEPSLANGDTSPAVVFVRNMAWLRAAIDHVSVNGVLRRIRHAVSIESSCEFASAPSSHSSSQVSAKGERFASAFASTTPENDSSASLVGRFDRRQSAGDEASQIIFNVPMRLFDHPVIIGAYGH